jgi:FlaA1/EpsC-like NDP-sugar epimerase
MSSPEQSFESQAEDASDVNGERRRISLRRVGAMLYDALAASMAWMLALMFRFSFEAGSALPPAAVKSLLWVSPLCTAIFLANGLYRGLWHFASIPDLVRIGRAIGIVSIATLAIAALAKLVGPIPRSVFILFPVFLLLLTAGARLTYRAWKEYLVVRRGRAVDSRRPVIVLGAGSSGVMLLKDLRMSAAWRVVGVLDDHRSKIGNDVCGHRVLGPITEIAMWARKLGVREAIIAIPSARPERRAQIVKHCVDAGLHVMSMPSMEELLAGSAKASTLREIGLEDLIGRPQVLIDSGAISEILHGRAVLVTGAGGSIGSELCRQIARYKPRRLVLVEMSEFALYKIDQTLRESFPDLDLVPYAADVKDAATVRHILRTHPTSIVFHAAAYKHVPLMEEYNCWQAVRNNVYGTYQLAQACVDLRVDEFVLISTDKAVNPTNVMGASKRLAELVCLALQAKGGRTRFEVVRFGNVLGSAGSVIPRFQEQIARGGPVTVTHPEITRYFMSIPEAAQLVLQAAGMGRGGEVFVLDMGEPLKVVDVARNLIGLSGYTADQIKIVFTGLRPGEKLYEELLADSESTRETHHPKLRIARLPVVDAAILAEVLHWLNRNDLPSDEEVRRELNRFVPEYRTGASIHATPISAQVLQLRSG